MALLRSKDYLRLDVRKAMTVIDTLFVRNDSGVYQLSAQLFDNGEVIDLTGRTVGIRFLRPDGQPIFDAAVVEDGETGKIYYLMPNNVYAIGGTLTGEISVYEGTKRLTGSQFTTTIRNDIAEDEGLEADDRYPILTELIANVQTAIQTAVDAIVGLWVIGEVSKTLEEWLNWIVDAIGGKVDKITGKGLSTNDYSTAEKNKLSGIEAGAEVNVVDSVNSKTGAVVLGAVDVGALKFDSLPAISGDYYYTRDVTTYTYFIEPYSSVNSGQPYMGCVRILPNTSQKFNLPESVSGGILYYQYISNGVARYTAILDNKVYCTTLSFPTFPIGIGTLFSTAVWTTLTAADVGATAKALPIYTDVVSPVIGQIAIEADTFKIMSYQNVYNPDHDMYEDKWIYALLSITDISAAIQTITGQALGLAGLDYQGKITDRLSYEGVAGGVGSLDANGDLAQEQPAAKRMPTAASQTGKVLTSNGTAPVWTDKRLPILTVTPDLSAWQAVTLDHATGIFTKAGHGYSTGDPVEFTATLLIPTGLNAYYTDAVNGGNYYSAIRIDADTFQVADTIGSSTPMTFSNNGILVQVRLAGFIAYSIAGLDLATDRKYRIVFSNTSIAMKTTGGANIFIRPNSDTGSKVYVAGNATYGTSSACSFTSSQTKKYAVGGAVIDMSYIDANTISVSTSYGGVESNDKSTSVGSLSATRAGEIRNIAANVTSLLIQTLSAGAGLVRNNIKIDVYVVD